jgi:hypothetical protein
MEQTKRSGRRNRVTPGGVLEVSSARGWFLGNRGDLHSSDGLITRQYRNRAWICCTLAKTNGQTVRFDTPGHYTPLFFFDEAVALSAGHRPCAFCRNADYKRFRSAFCQASGLNDGEVSAKVMDMVLHHDRLNDDREQRTFEADAAALPSGTFVARKGEGPALIWNDHLYKWTQTAYAAGQSMLSVGRVTVLTPKITVGILRTGYVPKVRISGELLPD